MLQHRAFELRLWNTRTAMLAPQFPRKLTQQVSALLTAHALQLVTVRVPPYPLGFGPRSQVSQPQRARAADQVIQVGDIIMGRVTRINTRQASVEIICVGETVLREPHRGIIRKEVCVRPVTMETR